MADLRAAKEAKAVTNWRQARLRVLTQALLAYDALPRASRR